MRGYEKQELEQQAMFYTIFYGKPAGNAWKELNNFMVDAESAYELTEAKAKELVKKWGVKYSEDNVQERSAIYRKVADYVYTECMSKDDDLFGQTAHMAKVLELPEHLAKLADKGAKTAAYFNRCHKILKSEEKLNINEINALFDYDYEDGLSIRKQVFQANFNLEFEEISKSRRYSPEQEERYRSQCEALDIPYEFKNNIENALNHYRNLWNAENTELNPINIQEMIPGLELPEGEVCLCFTNSGFCRQKVIETQDNIFEMTRKFNIDETVSFKGGKLEQNKIKEDTLVVEDLGVFLVTNARLIYLSEKIEPQIIDWDQLEATEFDGATIITFKTKNEGDWVYKFPDEAADVLDIIINRCLKGIKAVLSQMESETAEQKA